MVRKLFWVSFVVTVLIYSGLPRRCLAGLSPQLEQAVTNIKDLIKSGDYASVQAAIDDMVTSQKTSIELPDALYLIAKEFRWADRRTDAKDLYQAIVQDYPNSSAASRAELGLSRVNVISLVKTGRNVEAQEAIEKLITDFEGHSDMPETLYWLGQQCEWVWNYDAARVLYGELTIQHGASTWAQQASLPSQKLQVFSLIDSGDVAAAQVAVDGLIREHSAEQALPNEVLWIARKYEDSKEYDQARGLYSRIIADFAKSDAAEGAHIHLAKMAAVDFVESGQLEQARGVADDLMRDFPDSTTLPEAVQMVGEYLYWQGQELQNQDIEDEALAWLEKAQEVFEIVKSQWPTSGVLPITYRVSGQCYEAMGDYVRAAAAFETMIADYPEDRYIWHALYELAQCYESMKDSAEMSAPEANVKIRAAYERILDEYPNCPLAEGVQQLLGRLSSSN